MARDTKLGRKRSRRDIERLGRSAFFVIPRPRSREAGICLIVPEVAPRAHLVARSHPKAESPMTPEEKLLRAHLW